MRQNETLVTKNQNMLAPSIQINIQQLAPNFDNLEMTQFEEEVSAIIDKETK